MIKKLGIAFLLVLMMFNLTGCTGGSYRITIGGVKSSQNELSGKYHSFSGYYYKKVKVKNGKDLSVNFSAETKKGEIIAKVIDSNGMTIKALNTGDNVILHKPGQYKLQVEGEKHKGNFTLSWRIK